MESRFAASRIVTALVGYASEETFFLGGGSSQ
jgi:hypothetical protein